jgi:hypothetical protein
MRKPGTPIFSGTLDKWVIFGCDGSKIITESYTEILEKTIDEYKVYSAYLEQQLEKSEK